MFDSKRNQVGTYSKLDRTCKRSHGMRGNARREQLLHLTTATKARRDQIRHQASDRQSLFPGAAVGAEFSHLRLRQTRRPSHS
jgi:hypothetical protein